MSRSGRCLLAVALALGAGCVGDAAPAGAAGACLTGSVVPDPRFADAGAGAFHPLSAAALGYGAYAPD